MKCKKENKVTLAPSSGNFSWGGGTTPTRIFFDTLLQEKGLISTKFAKDRNYFDRSRFRQLSNKGLISTPAINLIWTKIAKMLIVNS